MQLVALACPHCAAALPADENDRVFVCESCGSTSTVAPSAPGVEGQLMELERRLAVPQRPLPASGAVVLLPLWVLPIHGEELGAWASRLPREIRLPAVGLDRVDLVLRFAQHLSQADESWRTSSELGPRELRRPAAEIGMEDAFTMAELVALAHVEGWPPDPEVDKAEVPFGPPRLVDLPCVRQGGSLVDLVLGRAVHESILGGRVVEDQREIISITTIEKNS